jgi:hypothetical protein
MVLIRSLRNDQKKMKNLLPPSSNEDYIVFHRQSSFSLHLQGNLLDSLPYAQ